MKYYGNTIDQKDLVNLQKLQTEARAEIASSIDPVTGTVQAKLVSGTNIKTINNGTILGSGNLDLIVNPVTKASNQVLTYNGSAWVANTPDKDIKYAVFNTTTLNDIISWYNDSYLVLCKYSTTVSSAVENRTYYLETLKTDTTTGRAARFACPIGQKIYYIDVTENYGVATYWNAYEVTTGLPTVTAEDNGYFLRVVEGVWDKAPVQSAESTGF